MFAWSRVHHQVQCNEEENNMEHSVNKQIYSFSEHAIEHT